MTSSVRIDDLQRKYEENPRRYFAPLASELRRAGEARRAVALCEAGLASDPGHLSGHVVLAQALAELGDSAGAERAFERAVELDAENLIALRSLGDLARDRGDREAARRWYQHALEADPRDPELATRLSTLDAVPAAANDVAARAATTPTAETVAEPTSDPDASASAAPPAAGAPVAGVLDEAQLREFQEQRDAQEFTAGFFASLLDAQATPAEPVRVEPLASEAFPIATGVRDEMERPPEVTIAEEPPDVRPDEPEFLDDLMNFDAEGAVERHDRDALEAFDAANERALGDEIATDEIATDEIATDAAALDAAAAPRWELDQDVDLPLTEAPAESAPPAVEQLAIADDAPIEGAPIDDTQAPAAHVDEAQSAASDAPDEVWHIDAMFTAEAPVEDAVADQTPVDDTVLEPAPIEQRLPVDESPVDESPVDESPVDEVTHDEAVAEGHGSDEGASRLPFVTATMGTLLLQQGFRSDALQIFRQLAAQHPDDVDMKARVAELEAELEPSATTGDGVTVANWLRQLAHARPAAPTATEGDVAAAIAPAGAPLTAGAAAEEVVATESTDDVDDVDVTVDPVDQPSLAAESSLKEEAIESGDVDSGAGPSAAGDAGEEPAVADTLAAPDLLSSAAAAAASAVTWEASEATPAADDLFFGDDPLDWSEVTAPAATDRWEQQAEADRPGELEESTGSAATEPGQQWPAEAPPRESGSVAGLTLDQLLERPVPSADEMAAGALAAVTLVMQGDDEVDAQLAEATAEDPAALEHVLAPPPATAPATREPTSFSFEQFFQPAPSAAGVDAASVSPPAAPATNESDQAPPSGSRDEDAAAREADLADFHAWLAGLSKS